MKTVPISVSIALDGNGDPIALRFKDGPQNRTKRLSGKDAVALLDQLRRATSLLGFNGKTKRRRRRRKNKKGAPA